MGKTIVDDGYISSGKSWSYNQYDALYPTKQLFALTYFDNLCLMSERLTFKLVGKVFSYGWQTARSNMSTLDRNYVLCTVE